MVFKVKAEKLGGHVHVRFFAAPQEDRTFACLGQIACNPEEWQALAQVLDGMAPFHVVKIEET